MEAAMPVVGEAVHIAAALACVDLVVFALASWVVPLLDREVAYLEVFVLGIPVELVLLVLKLGIGVAFGVIELAASLPSS
eukprot:6575963-Ditylum_brightwellii.AAC.2